MIRTVPSELKLKPFVCFILTMSPTLKKVIRSIFIKTTTLSHCFGLCLCSNIAADLACPTSSKFRAITRSSPPFSQCHPGVPKCFEEVSHQLADEDEYRTRGRKGRIQSQRVFESEVLRELDEGTRPPRSRLP
ncbi:hypothetical protein BASA83_006623 [Batrachochytrium salamandrivorans]|nr:hypothetical protein BASA83_006623 [Batrachochytrium salamandrivorans]